MADIRESFPILEDATGAGVALSKSQAGDVAAGKVGLTAFAFKDVAGNLVLPTLDSEGRLIVSSDSAGVPVSAAAKVVGSLTEVTVAEISLITGKTYGKISANVACFRETVFRVVSLNGAATVELGYAAIGPGMYNFRIDLGATEIIAGATGTQKIQVLGTNATTASDMRANVAALQYA